MRRLAKLLAVVLLVLAPAALTSAIPARSRADGRSESAAARREERQAERRPAAVAPPRAQPYPAPPSGVYASAVPPGYRPNSLGAEWGQQQDQARSGVREGRMMPLGQIMQQIKRGTPGRLLDAGLEPGPDGRPAYRVRWAAAGGRRIDFIVDAVTGAVLARSGY